MGLTGKNKAWPGMKTGYFYPSYRVILLLFFLILLLPIRIHADPEEARIKSFFLGMIAKQVEWPKSAEMDNPTKPFLVVIFGEDPFENALEETFRRDANDLKSKTIKGKIVEIKYINHIEDIPPQCHMLYISPMQNRSLAKIIEFTRDKPILTLSDDENFAREGVLVQFILLETTTVEERLILRITINETACHRAGLVVKEELLKGGNVEIINPFDSYPEKTGMLTHIVDFVTWPPGARMNAPSKKIFKISVLGQNVFGNLLEKTYRGKTLKDRTVNIRYISSVKDIGDTDLLFISNSMKNNITEIVAFTKDKPILTIGDTKGFADAGIYINFYYDGPQLTFEVNEKAGKAIGFQFSWHMLKAATIVGNDKPQK